MNALISTVMRTILRGGIYKGMRHLGMPGTIALMVVAAVVTVLTAR